MPSVSSSRARVPHAIAAASATTTAVRGATNDPAFKLADLGVYGFDRHETAILAALVTEDPLLLVGRSGTGKTFLLNTLSEALGLEHRHYNASLISFDDLVGFPYPDDAHTTVRFLETPATVWGAESVLIDEISRCKPEHQNRLFSLVHERRLQGLLLGKLRYRWAAMNPCTSDQGGTEDYSGSEALDPALADRFALVVTAADWSDLTSAQQTAIVAPSGEGCITPQNERLRDAVAAWREQFLEQANTCPARVITYVTTVVNALNGAGVRISPRRARLLARSLVAASIVEGRAASAVFRSVLDCSLPHSTWGEVIDTAVIAAAHRAGWDASRETAGAWIHAFLAEPSLSRKLCVLLVQCSDPDEGSQAVAQLIANESPDRAAAFAFVTYPAALAGALPMIGAEGVNDLAKLAVPLLDVEGEISWQERLSEKGTSHPTIAAIGQVLAPLRDSRLARARQFLTACVVRQIPLEAPGPLEQQMHEGVKLLRKRVPEMRDRS
jgi:MoxR-like ATPase